MKLLHGGDALYFKIHWQQRELTPLLIHDIAKRPEASASPKQAMKLILRPRFGIDPDPDHTLFADALFIRRIKTDGLLELQII